jgi:hypothetical protein
MRKKYITMKSGELSGSCIHIQNPVKNNMTIQFINFTLMQRVAHE